jgi:hypothetical protein
MQITSPAHPTTVKNRSSGELPERMTIVGAGAPVPPLAVPPDEQTAQRLPGPPVRLFSKNDRG